MCWGMAKTIVPIHIHLMSAARRERSRGRTSWGAEAFPELPAVLKTYALFWVQHLPFLSSPKVPCIHYNLMKELHLPWLCDVKHWVRCLNVMLLFYENLKSLTFIPFKVCVACVSLHKNPQSPSLAKPFVV